MTEDLGIWAVPIAMLGGAIRVSTPFLFVSLGECLTERSGRINLGLEGTLVFGAMAGYALAYESNSAWIGVLAAAIAGAVFGLLHGWLCRFKGVNDIAMGIALMLLGIGLAFFFGKPYIQPVAPDLPSLPLGWWSEISQLRAALQVNVLFLLGIGLAFGMAWMFRNTALGLRIRVVGDSAEAARAIGIAPDRVRLWSTAAGGAFAGVAGAYLSLYYPGSWNEGLSSGQGLMAVALVIFARWNPVMCLFAALLFGAAGALGPALQTVGFTSGYYIFFAAPYVLTLALLIFTSTPGKALDSAPGALSITK